MKKAIFIGLIALFTSAQATAQKSEEKAIKEVIMAFSKAGDQNNADKLGTLLDDNYRIVMNRLFGSKEVSIMPKSLYLQKIKSKEFGGDNREVSIKKVLINGTTATVQATFKGSKSTFVSFIVLIKNEKGNWKLVSDIPIIE